MTRLLIDQVHGLLEDFEQEYKDTIRTELEEIEREKDRQRRLREAQLQN